MTRRTTSLVAAGIVLAALLAVSFFVPMPYVVMSPGLTENTLGSFNGARVITVEGHKTYPTSGRLDLTTVSVTAPDYSPRLNEVLSAWWAGDEIVVPRDVAYPPDQSVEDVEQTNQNDMASSQNSAIAAGLAQAGIDSVTVRIDDVESGAPADGVLQKGDTITSVDGRPVTSIDVAVAEISSVTPGDRIDLVVDRDGKAQTVQLTTEPSPDDESRSRVGVALGEVVDPPFDVKIKLGQRIGGPSAGTMFSLAIYDLITPGELTGGRFIAGTGTITAGGTVGVIGGVQQKIAGAYDEGATVFLVPAGDCAEAAASDLAGKMMLVKVETLNDAVKALEALGTPDQKSIATCE